MFSSSLFKNIQNYEWFELEHVNPGDLNIQFQIFKFVYQIAKFVTISVRVEAIIVCTLTALPIKHLLKLKTTTIGFELKNTLNNLCKTLWQVKFSC